MHVCRCYDKTIEGDDERKGKKKNNLTRGSVRFVTTTLIFVPIFGLVCMFHNASGIHLIIAFATHKR
jgi:hypothetical protein